MNDLDLKLLWRQQELTPPIRLPDVELVGRMKKKMRKFDRTIFWRDIRELAACVYVLYAYHGMLLKSSSTLSQAGCWVVMLSVVVIAGELIYTRHKHKPASGSAPLREYLSAEVQKVARQVRLLETVLWWYILPIMIGAEMYALGKPSDLADKVVMTLTFIFVSAVVWWANRYAARKTLRPLLQELENTLKAAPELSDSTSTTGTQP